jgi:hypothetical protein
MLRGVLFANNHREQIPVHRQTPATSSPNPRLIGYARVSTDEQDLSLQIDALTKQGIPATAIFMDKLSGAKVDRPGLAKCPTTLRPGDILVVWRNVFRGDYFSISTHSPARSDTVIRPAVIGIA